MWWTDRRTNGPTKRGVESRSTRLKRGVMEMLNAVVYINRNKNLKQRKEWGRLINRYTQTVKSTWGLEGGLKAYRNHCSLHLVMRRWFDQMADFPPGSYCLTWRKIIKLYLHSSNSHLWYDQAQAADTSMSINGHSWVFIHELVTEYKKMYTHWK